MSIPNTEVLGNFDVLDSEQGDASTTQGYLQFLENSQVATDCENDRSLFLRLASESRLVQRATGSASNSSRPHGPLSLELVAVDGGSETTRGEADDDADPEALDESTKVHGRRKKRKGECKAKKLTLEGMSKLAVFSDGTWNTGDHDKSLEGLVRRVESARTSFLERHDMENADNLGHVHTSLARAHSFMMLYKKSYKKNQTDAKLKELTTPVRDLIEALVGLDIHPCSSLVLLEVICLHYAVGRCTYVCVGAVVRASFQECPSCPS